ncbi:MAG TPA: RNA 2'-phosphotransferase [Saprospirales bacterium]|nr:RNA 2'-phosphotransferase [Saprospirales bacterium]
MTPIDKKLLHTSKFLSLVLRHQPELIGIHLDNNGWTNVDILIEKANQHGVTFDKAFLELVVATNPKKRFAWNESHTQIRANQGHSVPIDLGIAGQTPPDMLYHGTAEHSVSAILQSGLDKRSRQHVHLSADLDTARKVGQRHGKPFIFIVLAGQMAQEGHTFYLSDNGVWLTDHVPAKFLTALK